MSKSKELFLFIAATLSFNIQSGITPRIMTFFKGIFKNATLEEFNRKGISKNALLEELNRIGSSPVIREINKTVMSPLYKDFEKPLFFGLFLEKKSEIAACQEYQQLGEEAQSKVGIPKEYQLPVTFSEFDFNSVASVHPHKIRLAGHFKSAPYGLKKFSIYHEAIHAKYCHSAVTGLMFLPKETIKVVYEYLTHKKLDLPDVKCHGFSLQELPNIISEDTLRRFQEKCADTEGACALDCHKCLEAVLIYRPKITSTKPIDLKVLNDGYLSYEEILNIVNDLKSKNRLCNYHKCNQDVSLNI